MALFACIADHQSQGLAVVERLTPRVAGLDAAIAQVAGVDGVIVLATCNRVEITVEATAPSTMEAVDRVVAHHFGADAQLLTSLEGRDAVEHSFRLACGLESQVVGEREIAGQMRRALAKARSHDTASFVLAQCYEGALRASKQVERQTGLAGRGRSIVAVGLGLAEPYVSLPGCVAVIVGTGNYAGAVSAALKERGVGEILVYSESGRAQRFADVHQLHALDRADVVDALVAADLVVTCRGFASPAVPTAKVARALDIRESGRDLTLLDLAVTHDVEADVASLEGVHVITLDDITDAVPDADRRQVRAAEDIIVATMKEFYAELSIHGIGSDIAALHAWTRDQVELEIARLGEDPNIETIRSALTRLGNTLVHLPTVMLRRAAEQDRTEPLLADMYEVIDPDSTR